MSADLTAPPVPAPAPTSRTVRWGRWLPGSLAWRGPARMVERNAMAYRRMWPIFLSGFFEPLLYLLSIGIGVGELVGDLPGPNGPVSYDAFVAPGLLAAAAMNGAIFDATINFFVRFKYIGTYRAAISSPLRPVDIAKGEVAWSLLRGGMYSGVFLVTMLVLGLVESAWALLAVPAALLIGFGFAGIGLAGATFMRSWIDFDKVMLALLPMFLFSGVFFPLSEYPDGLAWLVRVSPLYQGVALERALILGGVSWASLGQATYLAVMGFAGMRLGSRRLDKLMQP